MDYSHIAEQFVDAIVTLADKPPNLAASCVAGEVGNLMGRITGA